MAVSQKLTLTEVSVDTLANSSRVRILWTSTQTGESHNDYKRTGKFWISYNNNELQYDVEYTLPAKKTKTILDEEFTVPHDKDGAGTVAVRTWMDTDISAGVVKLSKSLVLTPIPRASTIGATNASVESTSMIGVNRKSEAYTHSIAFAFGDLVGYIDDAGNITEVEIKHTGSSIPFQIKPLFYEYMADKPSEICQLVCRTYNADTLVGESQAIFTISADPELCRPLIDCDVKDVNGETQALTGDPNVLVRYKSHALCTVAATARNCASVTVLKVNGEQTEGSFTVENTNSGSFLFSAEDSRGFTAEATVSKTLIPYIPPTLNAKITRTDPTSGNGILSASGQCWTGNFGVAVNIPVLRYRVNGDDWETADLTVEDDGISYSVNTQIHGLTYTETSIVEVTTADALTQVDQRVTVQPGIPVFDWGREDFRFHVPVKIQDVDVLKELQKVNGGPTIVALTQAEYDALTDVDPDVLYMIVRDDQ